MPIELLFENVFPLTQTGVPDIPLPEWINRTLLGNFFVTMPIGKVGTESRNNRIYPRKAYEQMVNTINIEHPMGWWGHSDDDQRSLHVPAVQWIAATIADDGMVWGKLAPLTADVQRYFEVSLAMGSAVGNSLYGEGKYEEDGKTVSDLQLHYIDLLAKGSWVGVPETSHIPTITAESIRAKENRKMMEYTQEQLSKFVSDSAKLTAAETALSQLFGGNTLSESLANAAKIQEASVMDRLNAVLEERVKVPAMRPIVLKMLHAKPKTVQEAESAVEALVNDPVVIEMGKIYSVNAFGGTVSGEAADADKSPTSTTTQEWRDALIKNAAEKARRIGAIK